jgi:hypothetical protein
LRELDTLSIGIHNQVEIARASAYTLNGLNTYLESLGARCGIQQAVDAVQHTLSLRWPQASKAHLGLPENGDADRR